MDKYNCEICGKIHNIYRGLESPLPEILTKISKDAEDERINKFGTYYVIDNELLLIDGQIQIYLEGHNDPYLRWKVWVSTKLNNLLEKKAELEEGKDIVLKGRLESIIPYYEKSFGLAVLLKINIYDEYAVVEIREESQIKLDQSQEINRERLIEVMQKINHGELNKKAPEFKKPFSERFMKELDDVEGKYMRNDKDFVINICNSRAVIFQIISRRLLESTDDTEPGYGIHLPFDTSFEENRRDLENLRKTKYYEDFTYYNLDDIPTYQLDLATDIDKLQYLVQELVRDIFEIEIEKVELDHFGV